MDRQVRDWLLFIAGVIIFAMGMAVGRWTA